MKRVLESGEESRKTLSTQNSPISGWLCLAAVIILTVLGVWGIMGRILVADDDNLWLSYAVDKTVDRAEGDSLENNIIEFARSKGADDHAIARLEMRRDYDTNYALALLAWAGIDRLILSSVEEKNRRTFMRLGLALPLVVAVPWFVVFGLLMNARSHLLWFTTIAVFSWLSIVAFCPTPYSTFIVFGEYSLVESTKKFILFAIDPAPAFSIFGFTPRNMLSTIVLAAALARWQALDRVAYGLLLLGVGIHTSLGLMVLCSFIANDLTLARKRLYDPICLSLITVSLAYAGYNESMLGTISPLSWSVLLLVTLSLVGTIAAGTRLMSGSTLPTILTPIDRISAWLLEGATQPRVKQDVIFFTALIGFCFILGYAMSSFASPFSVRYFWGQLPTRFYAAVGPVVAIGVLLLLSHRFGEELMPPIASTMAGVAIVLGLLSVRQYQPPMKTIGGQLAEYESALTSGRRLTQKDPINERLIYYELGRAIRGGADPTGRLKQIGP